MVIEWIAHACFRVTLEDGRCLVFDPFCNIGYQMPKIRADLVTVSHGHFDHNAVDALTGDFRVFDKAGTYAVDGVEIRGIPSFHDDAHGEKRGGNLIFRVRAEGLTLTHLGDLGHVPDETLYQELVGTDVLMIPVGGNYTIDAVQALEICRRVEPNIILPMHYKTPGLTVDVARRHLFEEVVKGYFDCSQLGKSEFSYVAADKKKRTRVIWMDPSAKQEA